MKTKSGGSRARLSKLPSPSPATRSLPLLSLNVGEVHGECDIDRMLDRMSRGKNDGGRSGNEAGASRCGENNKIDVWAEDYDDLDPSEDFVDSDLEIKTCIFCLKHGGDDVLLCSEIGCPVAVHRKCAPEFDGLEKYYCPYCVYKRAELRKEKLKKRAMDMKKHLSDFLNFKLSGGDNVRTNEGRSEGKELNTLAPSGARNCGDCGDRVVTNQVEKRFVLVESGQQNIEDNTKLGDSFAKSRTVIEHQRDLLAPNSCQSQEKLPGVESLLDSVSKEQSNEHNVTTNKEPENLEGMELVDEGGHESIEEDNVEEENVVDASHNLSEKGVSNAVKPKQRREEEQSLPEASGSDNFVEPIAMHQGHHSSEGKRKAQAQNVDEGVHESIEEENVVDGSHHLSEKGVSNAVKPKRRREEEQSLPEASGADNFVEPISMHLGHGSSEGKRRAQAQNVDEGLHKSIEEDSVEEENVVSGSHHLSEKGVSNAVKPKRRREEEQNLSEAGIDNFDSDKEPISRHQRHRLSEGKKKVQAQNVDSLKKLSSPRGANPKKSTKSRNAKVSAPGKSRKQQASATKSTNFPFANEKRKRKDWKTEEEEMLREAVHKFSSTVNKNLPWRKILEFGRHVFDPTRNPVDLKDKWRNLKAKESSSTSRK